MNNTITIKKTKSLLAGKSKARKKAQQHQVSMCAIAASSPKNLLPEMKLERRAIKTLKGLKKRVRKTEKEQLERVANSIRTLGQAAPILIEGSGEIINGHIVVKALTILGAKEVLCAVIDHLDENERALLHVALNRISECGDWDIDALGPLLIEFEEIGFDLGVTGFSLPELDITMTAGSEESEEEGQDEGFVIPNNPVTIPGDLWTLGKHRLLCADSRDAASYETVLNGQFADVVFTDCPWNIPIAGFVSGLGKTKHQDFKMGAGELSAEAFADFCDCFHQLCTDHLCEGGVFFSCIDWRSVNVIMASGTKAGLRHINTAVWNKGSGAMGTPYRSAHEFIVIFNKGKKLAVNNVELGKHGRDRTNVWPYPGANQSGSSASKALVHHPTPKPVEMVEDALKDVSNRGARVLDPFLGSGTTILAAQRSGRRACCIELDPAYVDVAIHRWQAMTGKQAVHAATGKTFEQLTCERGAEEQQAAA